MKHGTVQKEINPVQPIKKTPKREKRKETNFGLYAYVEMF